MESNEIIERMKSCKSLEDLYILRAFLSAELETVVKSVEETLPGLNMTKLLQLFDEGLVTSTVGVRKELLYYRGKVENRINVLESRLVFLDGIETPVRKFEPMDLDYA
jgi:hypothetical protein